MVYPVPDPETYPFLQFIHSIRDYYPLWQVSPATFLPNLLPLTLPPQLVYQAAVFISRSSISLGLPPLPSSQSVSNSEDSSHENIVDEDSEGEPLKPIPGSHKIGSSSDPIQVDSSDEEDEFIVEDIDDDDNQIASLPIEYSMNRAQPVEISFKVVVQLLVHVACQPHHLRATYMEARLKGD